jgi:uncharacterized membrane protein YdjX (TVP38/TMEM64 family)
VLRRILLALILVGVVIVGAQALLRSAGIDTSPDALRGTIRGFGWWSPAAYVGLLALRHFLLLPSTLVMTLGGGLFGVGLGTAAGSLGLLLSGVIEFWVFRAIKPHWLVSRMEQRAAGVSNLAERGAPLVLFVSTAIPPTPMSFFYWAASLTELSIPRFAAVIAPSGAIRALLLSMLGAGLIESDWRLAAGALAATGLALALSLLSPRLRAALLPASPG